MTAALFRIENSVDPAEVHEALDNVAQELVGPEHAETRRSLGIWLQQALYSKGWTADEVESARSLENLMTLLEAAQERWWNEAREEGRLEGRLEGRQEGRQEGRRQGKRQGEATIVLKLLQLKFGALDSSTRSRVRRAEPADLERWAQRLLTADTLDEVFT